MAKNEKGFNLKGMLQGAVKSTKAAVESVDLSDVKEKMPSLSG